MTAIERPMLPTVTVQRKILAQASTILPAFNDTALRSRGYSLWTDGKITTSDSTARADEEGSFHYISPIVLGGNLRDPVVHFETDEQAIERIAHLPKEQREEAIRCSVQDAYVVALLRRLSLSSAFLESTCRKVYLFAAFRGILIPLLTPPNRAPTSEG